MQSDMTMSLLRLILPARLDMINEPTDERDDRILRIRPGATHKSEAYYI